MKLFTTILLLTLAFSGEVFANSAWYNSSDLLLGIPAKVKCATGVSCAITSGKLNITAAQTAGTSLTLSSTLGVTGATTLTGGLTVAAGQRVNYGRGLGSLTGGTSTTPSATTVYLTQIFVEANTTLTGIKLNNAATVGTNKYVVALFDSSGAVVANSALAGVLSAGANVYQAIPFTATYAVKGPGIYWIGLYVDGATDRFYSLPAFDESRGLAGSVTGQTFGTVASVTLPTSFTADKGPVAFTY
jgi:hypothetical protein